MKARLAHRFQPAGGPVLHVDDPGGSGRAVVFQHGLCGNAAQPAEVFPEDGRFRRVTLEARGHGASEAGDPHDLSIKTFTSDLADLIESNALAPIAVGGISMGAAIALRLAITRPDLVRALIIARPAWSTVAAPPNMRPNAEVGALLQEYDAGEARRRFEASETASILSAEAPDNLASLMGFFARQPQAVTAALLQAIAADGPGVVAADLRALSIPVLVIGHDRDAIHPMNLAMELAQLIPSARFCRITAKAEDRLRYVSEFRAALAEFLGGLT